MTRPLIIFSDHPAAPSGLARITRDLATRIYSELSNEFRVATLGYGAPGAFKLPFMQYQWRERDDFIPAELPFVWNDFCGDDPGILLTIGDIQRFLGLADPKFCSEKPFAEWITQMRRAQQLKLWGYFPIDAHSIGGKLGPQLGHTLSHYDRRLVPSEWAREIVRRTLPNHDCDVLPHGIDTSVFQPCPREEARDKIGALLAPALRWPQDQLDVPEDALWIGIVATNQSRKALAEGIETVAQLRKTRPVFLWLHTDVLKREWSVLELLSDFGLLRSAMVTTGNLTDETMSWAYSALDLTLGVGRGEGFSYCGAESIFCGTPHYAGNYGAHVEYMDSRHLISPAYMRIEGALNLLRPIYRVEDWVQAIGDNPEPMLKFPSFLDWNELWPRFADWIRAGVPTK